MLPISLYAYGTFATPAHLSPRPARSRLTPAQKRLPYGASPHAHTQPAVGCAGSHQSPPQLLPRSPAAFWHAWAAQKGPLLFFFCLASLWRLWKAGRRLHVRAQAYSHNRPAVPPLHVLCTGHVPVQLQATVAGILCCVCRYDHRRPAFIFITIWPASLSSAWQLHCSWRYEVSSCSCCMNV